MTSSLFGSPAYRDALSCPASSDQDFGPRINPTCRAFDFTLAFEDAFFSLIVSAVFLAISPWRIWHLSRSSVKVASFRLALSKIAVIATLTVLHLAFTVVRLQSKDLYTPISSASGALSVIASFSSLCQSFFHDQRSVKPSDVLILYFSASFILGLPRLRTLWSLDAEDASKALWTLILIFTILAIVVESIHKTRALRPAYKLVTVEQTIGFWSRGFFVWLLPMFRAGYSTVLRLKDVPEVDIDLQEQTTRTDLRNSFGRSRAEKFRLLRTTLACNKAGLLLVVIPRIILSVFRFAIPFLIERAVAQLNSPNDETNRYFGQSLVGAFVLVYVGIAVSKAVYWHMAYRVLARIRAGLTGLIYQHTIHLRACDVQHSAALTLMGTDVERIVETLRLMHEIWASVPEIAVAVWLLSRQVSYAALLPVSVCLASIAATSLVAKRFGPAQRQWVEGVEKRVAATSDALGNIKTVKMLGFETHVSQMIRKLREIELQISSKFRTLLVWSIVLSNAPSDIAPFATLAVSAVIAITTSQSALQVSQVFSSLAIISMVTEPLVMFCQALPNFTQAVSCFGRIEKFLLLAPATQTPAEDSSPSLALDNLPRAATDSGSIFRFQNATISWGSEDGDAVLHDLTADIKPGFTAIIGPVGAGKTTLLSSLIGETFAAQGAMSNPLSYVAFSPQTPWIMDDTIARNITAGQGTDVDAKWMDICIDRCGLRADIESFPSGLQSPTGPNGSFLSGGQRQRVALARAMYSKRSVVILDDITSGFDPATSKEVVAQLFSRDGHFRKAGISVVLATHDMRLLHLMDNLIVLECGKIVRSGPSTDIVSQMPSLAADENGPNGAISQGSEVKSGEESRANDSTEERPPHDARATSLLDEQRQQGNWSVYRYYAGSAGIWPIASWVVCTLAGAVISTYTTIWVDEWISSSSGGESADNLGLYLSIYSLLVVATVASTLGECFVFIVTIIKNTASNLHSDLLNSTLKAPLSFFLETDTGSIVNRFSQDMNLIDMSLPLQAIQFMSGFAYCFVRLIVIAILGRYLAAAVPVMGLAVFLVQRYYLRTSRQVRLLEIETKAPLYTHFTDSIKGVATIRAYHLEDTFGERLGELLNQSQKPFYMLSLIQQWLTLVLDLMVGGLAVMLVAVALSLTGSRISAGALGVALVLSLQFNNLLSHTILAWTKFETSVGAVARVQQFVQTTPEEHVGTPVPAREWPVEGTVEFDGMTACYLPQGPPVVLDVNLKIESGEKLAICGPSGSGKSSLIMALLKLVEVREGRILVNGTDIAAFQNSDLRSHLNPIPQEPYFLPGTFKFNLDPHGQTDEATLISALKKVKLWEKVEAKGGLDTELVMSELSVGERQLLSLARAILVPSKILILDEAMSNVDENTEAFMQDIIMSEFKDRTIIAVMHRYSYINQFDKVLVMRKGRMVECDKPSVLLGRDSMFRKLYHSNY
ncbi:P-loop containing nucleoside triphosphate hydrolase protein [Stachybotrys elegans]|uniref:P-loop containing nucleoside triphosphate hydrolase protein n=1 Tax=Stachybotrys elegans TaxID=80388 RepID=A0A8K0SJ38_9HYPO|nr:P-loop containing nucleoside triphosphate hydrolase protein [Stachybotrys elegans]